MASQKLSTDLNFLTDAAHLLRQTAPQTSAHFMRQRADLMYHNGLAQDEVQRQHVCDACGHIMVPGLKTTLTLEPRPEFFKSKKRATSKQSMDKTNLAGPTKSITCGHCKSVTRINLPAPEPASSRRVSRPSATKKTTMPAPSLQDPRPTANASSKKRAKNRKRGLQALLSGQQQKSSSSLSLADFMH